MHSKSLLLSISALAITSAVPLPQVPGLGNLGSLPNLGSLSSLGGLGGLTSLFGSSANNMPSPPGDSKIAGNDRNSGLKADPSGLAFHDIIQHLPKQESASRAAGAQPGFDPSEDANTGLNVDDDRGLGADTNGIYGKGN